MLHRDIKPHNILLSDDGPPVLADFGIVALHQNEPPTYAAPELGHREPATVKSDIYGLGATLYTISRRSRRAWPPAGGAVPPMR